MASGQDRKTGSQGKTERQIDRAYGQDKQKHRAFGLRLTFRFSGKRDIQTVPLGKKDKEGLYIRQIHIQNKASVENAHIDSGALGKTHRQSSGQDRQKKAYRQEGHTGKQSI